MPDADYAILGSVSVRLAADAAPITLSDQHKLLLGRLLVVPGARVTTDALIEALWGETPGANPRNAVQVTVSAVRGLLGDSGRPRRVIVTDGDAYRIDVADPLRIDAERFRRLAQRGHDLLDRAPRAARAMLSEALSTWRGPLLGDLGQRPWASGHASELDSVRDRAEVDLNEVRLALGECSELEAPLRLQIMVSPHDERRRGQLVRALDGAGRSAEAQMAYRAAYRDLGAVGPELQRIGEHVARGARALVAPPRADLSALHGGGSAGVLLCALLRPRRAKPEDPGIGMLSLIVDSHAGEPQPVNQEMLVAAFDDADAALRAAAAIASQRSLPARIGIHVGGVVRLGETLVGPGPARCRQLAEAAHPDQVLITAAARAGLAPTTELRDLGEQRFFDLGPGERVFELPRDLAGARFPPPATLSRLPHNLPVQTTRFVGRDVELAALSRMVAGGCLVTLTGAGGCGKTRLGLQLAAGHAAAFTDGAWFIELAEVAVGADAEALSAVAAHQLGVRALPGETQLGALVRHLSDRAALVVIDNCEQVHAAVIELVATLRAACRGVCLVATSRRPLRIDGEHVLKVSSMDVDVGAPHGLPCDAVQLLLERAGPPPGDPLVSEDTLACAARICRALDGLPLAIELVAAQVPMRGWHAVAAEVEAMMRGEHHLSRFANDDPRRPDRQRTIESAIDWSHRLLSDAEQRVLRRLAVFHGTFAVAEAQRAAEPDVGGGALQSLVNCSMVAVAPPLDGVSRLRLVGPIRAFALDQLKRSGELESARATHAHVYRELAIGTAPRLFGPQEQPALQLLEAEHDNVRTALAWHVDRGEGPQALRIVGALWWLWFSHGHLEEGCTWVRRALAIDDEPSQERVRALRAGSHLAWWRGDHAQCDAYNVALEQCARTIGDEWGLAWVAMGFGATEVFRDPRKALPLFEESKRRFDALGRRWESGYTLHLIGGAQWFGGDDRAAGAAFEAAVEIFDVLGHRSVLASVERCAGLMAARCGNPARGTALCMDALRLSDAIEDRAGSAQALNFLGAISRDETQWLTVVLHHGEALALARAAGDLWATCWALDGLAGAARELGDPEIAARLLAKSARLATRSWYVPSPRERELRDEDVAALRVELGELDFERTTAEGGLMGVGEIVSCALAFAARHR